MSYLQSKLEGLMDPSQGPLKRRSALFLYLLVMTPLILGELPWGVLRGAWVALRENRGIILGWPRWWAFHYGQAIQAVWKGVP